MASARRQAILERDAVHLLYQDDDAQGGENMRQKLRETEEKMSDLLSELEMQALVLEERTCNVKQLERSHKVEKQNAIDLQDALR